MEFNKIINSNYFLVKKIGQQTYQQHLVSTLRCTTIKTISNGISPSYNKLSTHSLHTLPSFLNTSSLKDNSSYYFPNSQLSYPSQLSQTFSSTSLFNYTPFYRKEQFRISSLFSKEESKSSEKVIHQLKNEVLAPPLTEEQIAKHEKEKEIYQRIRKFEHYNYFRSISKTSYYDTLEIDEEDKKLSLLDRIIHRRYSHRRIQHKYNSRNLNRGFVFIEPEKAAQDTTTLCDCSKDRSPRELMVLLGWWNCHPKHLKKYVKLYSSLGHPILAHISPTLLLVVPKILNIKNEHLMKQLFQLWREQRAKGEEYKIMFHTFSDNGSYVFAHFTYVLQVNLRKYKKKMKVREQRILKKLNLADTITVTSSSTALPTQFSQLPPSSSSSKVSGSGREKGVVCNPKEMTEKEFLVFLAEKEKNGEWKKNDRMFKLVNEYRQARKDFIDYEKFFYCMEAAIMDSGPSLLTQSVITRGITAGITSMKCMKYFGVKHTHYSPTLSKMICYFYYIFVRQPSIAKYLLDIYYPAFYNVPKHMAYMFMYGNGDRVICPDLIEPYIYNLQKNGFLVRRAYFEGSDHVMHYRVHREVYEHEVLKFIHDIREHSKIECKSGVRVIYDEKTGIIQDHEKILIPDKRKSNIKSVWARAIADEEHFRFLGIIPKRSGPVESMKNPFSEEDNNPVRNTKNKKSIKP
ncbi:hypothetical protein PIROE2DRAFT_12782 [Piromyces sp. E2]|nr:hypothetical protein PIROE2DRAFT_12782 [Piromyces sp. E2]|eukprot:OUM61243.1 hypothetical protein PIROE2DRAFT_12782 [Piromyces sp. E2]